jgi:choline transporter-like protein 2/4/5
MYCLPDSAALKSALNATLKTFEENFYKYFDVGAYASYIADIYKAWKVIAITVGVAVLASILYLLILRCCAGVVIFFSIFAIIGAFGAGGYWLYYTRVQYEVADPNYKYMTYGAYALWGVAGTFFLITLCCLSRIRLAVAIMKVTSQFIYRTPSTLFLPVIFFILVLAWLLFWVFLAVYIGSVGTPGPRPAPL